MATQKEVAAHLDLGERQVRNLLKDSVLPGSKRRGEYDLDACRMAYINYLRNQAKAPQQPEMDDERLDLEQERAKLTRSQRKGQDMKNELVEGRTIPTEVAGAVLSKVLVEVGGILNSMVREIKRKYVTADPKILELIDSEIAKFQNQAAKLDEHLDNAIDECIAEAEARS